MSKEPKTSLKTKWNNLSKGAKIAICVFSTVCITTAIVVPIVVVNSNSVESTITINLEDDETKSLIEPIKLTKNSNGDYSAQVKTIKEGTQIQIDYIKINENSLIANSDYTFSNNLLTIFAKAIKNTNDKFSIKVSEIKPIEEVSVSIESQSLQIDKTKFKVNEDVDLNISLISPSETTLLPNLLTLVTINEKPSTNYVYDSITGKLHIDKEYVLGNINIVAEATDVTKEGFKVTFLCDEHSSTYVYQDQDYSKEAIKKNVAYSYNVDDKKYSKDGKGQVNFRIQVDEGYEINYIWPKGIYGNLKQIEDASATDIYRLTKIYGDLTIKITTTKRYVKDFSCIGNYEQKTFTLKWNVRNIENITSTKLTIKHDGKSESITLPQGTNSYTISNVVPEKTYSITIAPSSNASSIQPLTTTKMLSNIGHEVSFPRLELTTKDGIYPTMNKEATWDIYTLGFHEGKDPYVNSLIELYNGEEKLFTSSTSSSVDDAKIKVRGNGSAIHYNDKKPLKIKLTNAADMLDGLRKHKTQDVNYANKDWILFPCCEDMGDLVGFTTESTLNFEYAHEYTYLTVYINDDYQGLYALVEANNEGLGEGDSQSRYKVNQDGFIIENDYYYYKEDISFSSVISNNEYQNVFTYPDLEDKKIKYSDYVSDINSYFDEMESAIKNNDDDLFDKYLDINSFAKWLVDFDILAQGDADGANRYLVKHNKDSKVYMGTPWDYEFLMGSYTPGGYDDIRDKKSFYYYYIKDRSDFKAAVRKVFDEVKNDVIKNIDNEIEKLSKDDFNRLVEYEKIRNNYSYKTYDESKNHIDTFIKNKIIELESKYAK